MTRPLVHPPTQIWHQLKLATVSLGLLGLTLAQPALAQEQLMRTLTVTGRGTEQVQTTKAQIRLGVEAQGKIAKEVQAEVARRSNAVVNLLKQRQVDKLETTGINLSPTYRYDNGVQTLTGYSASNMVSFRVATQDAGQIIDDAVKAGASRIDGISFIAEDSAIAAARNAALKEATQDAQMQANAVLDSLGLKSTGIVSIQVNHASAPPPRPFPMAADAMTLKQAAASPVMGGEQEVDASVTLQISY